MSEERFEDPTILKPDDEFTIQIIAKAQQLQYNTSGQVNIEAFTQAMCTVILNVYQKAVDAVPSGDQSVAKVALFDLLNQSCSGLLRIFAPEIALKPDLTEDAIIRAENDIIDEQYSHMSRQQKRAVNRKIAALQQKYYPNQ